MRSSGSRLGMSTWALNQGWDRKSRARRGTCIVGAVRELDPKDKATGCVWRKGLGKCLDSGLRELRAWWAFLDQGALGKE